MMCILISLFIVLFILVVVLATFVVNIAWALLAFLAWGLVGLTIAALW